jgi:predicted RNase H-like HicB family nuclease
MMPVEVHLKPSGKWWIASAPELGVITQGETYAKAQANLKEALALFIQSCLERGTLDQVLREAGFSAIRVKEMSRVAAAFAPPAKSPETRCRA